MSSDATACGSLLGYRSHRRRGEPTCQSCRDAKAAYQRTRDARQQPCRYPTCDRPNRARGYCGSHLSRIHRHGRVDPPTDSERFWQNVIVPRVGHVRGCWLWSAARSLKGYGRFDPHRGVHLLAHRYAYEQARSLIPVGLELDHLCRQPICVNPWHLEPVTKTENVRRQHAARRAAA